MDRYTFVDALTDACARASLTRGRRQLVRAGWLGTALMTVPQLAAIGLRATGQDQTVRFLPLVVLLAGIGVVYFTAGRIVPSVPSPVPHLPAWYLPPLAGMWIFQGGAFAATTSTFTIIMLLVLAPLPCVWGVLLSLHTNTVTNIRRRIADQLRTHGTEAQDVPALVDAWLAQPVTPHRATLLIRVGYTLENATDHATQVVSDEDLAAIAFVQDNLR